MSKEDGGYMKNAKVFFLEIVHIHAFSRKLAADKYGKEGSNEWHI